MAQQFGPQDALMHLVSQGYPPVQAAALVGNIMQESGMNPQATNPAEGAFGLMQWRLDRLTKLQDFAKQRGATPADPTVQLDFITAEMQGPESKAGQKFMAASDLPSANDALKAYIRYGDKSEEARLANAQSLLTNPQGPAPMTEPMPVAPQQAPPMSLAGPTQAPVSPAPAMPAMAQGNPFGSLGMETAPQVAQQKTDPFGLVRDNMGGTPIDLTGLRNMLAKLQKTNRGFR